VAIQIVHTVLLFPGGGPTLAGCAVFAVVAGRVLALIGALAYSTSVFDEGVRGMGAGASKAAIRAI
jgi:hypothetical protein